MFFSPLEIDAAGYGSKVGLFYLQIYLQTQLEFLEVTTRFELVNDGFAGRYHTIQKPLFFLGFSRVPKKISMGISIAHLV